MEQGGPKTQKENGNLFQTGPNNNNNNKNNNNNNHAAPDTSFVRYVLQNHQFTCISRGSSLQLCWVSSALPSRRDRLWSEMAGNAAGKPWWWIGSSEPSDEPIHRQGIRNPVWNRLTNGTGVAGRYWQSGGSPIHPCRRSPGQGRVLDPTDRRLWRTSAPTENPILLTDWVSPYWRSHSPHRLCWPLLTIPFSSQTVLAPTDDPILLTDWVSPYWGSRSPHTGTQRTANGLGLKTTAERTKIQKHEKRA